MHHLIRKFIKDNSDKADGMCIFPKGSSAYIKNKQTFTRKAHKLYFFNMMHRLVVIKNEIYIKMYVRTKSPKNKTVYVYVHSKNIIYEECKSVTDNQGIPNIYKNRKYIKDGIEISIDKKYKNEIHLSNGEILTKSEFRNQCSIVNTQKDFYYCIVDKTKNRIIKTHMIDSSYKIRSMISFRFDFLSGTKKYEEYDYVYSYEMNRKRKGYNRNVCINFDSVHVLKNKFIDLSNFKLVKVDRNKGTIVEEYEINEQILFSKYDFRLDFSRYIQFVRYITRYKNTYCGIGIKSGGNTANKVKFFKSESEMCKYKLKYGGAVDTKNGNDTWLFLNNKFFENNYNNEDVIKISKLSEFIKK